MATTLEQMIRELGTVRSSEADVVADPDDDEDSVWRHELRMPGPGETLDDVMRKAAEYRARTGVSAEQWIEAWRRRQGAP